MKKGYRASAEGYIAGKALVRSPFEMSGWRLPAR